jgi:acetoin utilization protein AcuB
VKNTKVKDIMSSAMPFVYPSDQLEVALDMMLENGRTHLPVVNGDNHFVGLISKGDVFALAMLAAADRLPLIENNIPMPATVSDVMQEESLVVSPEDRIGMAASRLIESAADCLPVVEQTKLVGVLNHSDFTRLFADRLQVALRSA